MSCRGKLDRFCLTKSCAASSALWRSPTTFGSRDAVVEQLGGKVETRVKGPTNQVTTGATAVGEIRELHFTRPNLAVDARLHF